MENGNNRPWYYSWVVIGLALFFIWPVGIALLILRMNHTKSTASFGKTQKILFYIVAGILFLAALGMFGDGRFFMGILYAAGGAAIVSYTKKTMKQSERFRQYINLIVNQGVESLDTIAAMSNISYDVVVADLNKMISQEILKNAVIDHMTRTVILPKQQVVQQPQIVYVNNGGGGTANAAPPQMVTVTCPGCGAKMAVAKGSVCNCEYCDTPVNA